MEVSPPQADRACRLLDALLKALVAGGAEVRVGEEVRPKTWVAVGDDRVSVRLEEELDREEAVESFFAHRHAVAHVPSGRLVLLVDDALGWGFRRRWADGKTPLEGRDLPHGKWTVS